MNSYLILKLGKRKRRMRAEKDRLSRLPEYLMDSILERVPVEDAVRTSVLSRNWRYRWTRMRSLILDEHFSEKLAQKGGAFGYNGFVGITNQLFNFVEGPILNVHLHIPKKMIINNLQDVNQWIFSLLIKHKSVRELVLTNSNKRPYQLPSYLFHFSILRKLHLKNCMFKPPPFEDLNNGFPHLNDLSLAYIAFEANLGETVIKLPQLEKLELFLCTNVYNFNIKATKLKSLRVVGCHDANFIRLLDSERLTNVDLFVIKPVPIPRFEEERVNIATMLSKLPYLVSLSADGCFLKYSLAEKIPKWLRCASAANRLQNLYFVDCNFGELDLLQGALLLLRNSPNLEQLFLLNVCMDRQQHLHVDMDMDLKPALAYLEAASSDCFDQTLNRLKTIRIRRVARSRPVLLLIKLLLDLSPNLEMISIEPGVTTADDDDDENDKFLEDVMRFPRASSKAELRLMVH